MTPRAASALALASALGALACGGGAARFATSAPPAEPAPRRAPGVAVDPIQPLAAPARRGSSDVTLVVLGAPRDLGAVRALVRHFFRALVDESPGELDALLADQAFIDASGGRQPARAAFRTRFSQLDFAPLRGVLLYRERELEIYGADDARALAAPRGVPSDLGADQVFVRVRLAVSHAGKTRLLPDEISLFLKPSAESFQILRIAEGTATP